MSLLSEAVVFILVSLVILNGLLSGAIVNALSDFGTSEEKEEARKDLMCGSGYFLYMPVTDFHGINIPIPNYSNVLIAGLITLSLVVLIRISSGFPWTFKYTILLFIAVWIAIKIIGFVLMSMAGPDCTAWAQETIDQASGIYSVAAVGGSLWALKIIWALRK